MRQRILALAVLVLVPVLSIVSCLVVTPLDEYEADSSTGAGGSGGGAGNSSSPGGSGGSSEGGSGGSQSDGQGGSAGVGTIGNQACTSNAECIDLAGGAPSRCSDGDCIALKTGECPLVYPEEVSRHENPIYVGAFATLPKDQPHLSSALFAFRLALGEISGDSYGGLLLPDGEGDTERRPLILVACDNSEDSVDLAAEHLINEVGTSAILATLLPGDLRRLFETYKDSGAFWLSPVGATEAVASLEDNGLVWTMLGQPKNLVPVYRDLVQDLVEPYVRDIRGAGEKPLKLVLLGDKDAFSQELNDLVSDELRWNDQSTSENLAAETFRGYSIDGNSDLVSIATEIIDFRPDIVVSTAGHLVTRTATGLIPKIETLWEGKTTAPRPFYVLSPFNGGDLDGIITIFEEWRDNPVEDHPERRLIGVAAAGSQDTSLQQDFALNLTNAFPAEAPNVNTGNYYDAFYFLAYAIYAAHEQNPTGADIASGMRRLLEGERFKVGLDDIAEITDELADTSTTIQLDGTVGLPNFDSDGIRIDPGAVYCLDASAAGFIQTSNALRYDPNTASFAGDFPCFPDFAP